MPSNGECFIHLQLPGTLESVVCARYALEGTRTGAWLGRLVYGDSYLRRPDAVPLDPIHLPLAPVEYRTARRRGMFGAVRDSAPDAWGRRVIEHRKGHSDLTELDYLMETGEDRAGALSFGLTTAPPAPRVAFPPLLALADLCGAAAVLEEKAPASQVPPEVLDLLAPGSSMGGARPKAVVEDRDALWIAKFPARADRWHYAPVERAMLGLAHRCGIAVPESRIERIGDDHVLMVKRFDRTSTSGGYLRHRFASALTLLDAEDDAVDRRNWSYLLLADELGRWSARPRQDRAELFRRAAFNALISNTDDHPRNHAVIAPGKEWHLAPAFDLAPNPQVALERRDLAMACGALGRLARRDNLLSASERFGLRREEADAVIGELKRIVSQEWRDLVRAEGGTDDDVRAVERAFLYEGFEYASA